MALSALAAILVKLAVAVLAYYQGRADYRELVEKEMENAGLVRLAEAQRWAADGGDATLGVRDPTHHTLDKAPSTDAGVRR